MKVRLQPVLVRSLLTEVPLQALLPAAADADRQRWLCLYFPHLPLEVYAGVTMKPQQAFVVASGSDARAQIISLSRAARARGLQVGMTVAAASALVPGLQISARDSFAEAAALQGVAAWAYQFTSWVSLAAPSAVLLEIGGSEQLFAGRARLIRCIDQGVRALGFRPRLAHAPTAQAATMLARTGNASAEDARKLPSALSGLRLTDLDLSTTALQGCARLGVRTVGELLRLPRDGLQRRFGNELLDYFDRALGRVADPRAQFAVPDRFSATLPFSADVTQTDALLFGLQRLLKMLQGFLRARDAGAQTLNLRLLHAVPPHTEIELRLLAPQRAPQHLLSIARERIDRTVLRAPVQALELQVSDLQPWTAAAGDLFAPGKSADSYLFERLRARLGAAHIRGLATAATHSPECAWRYRLLSERLIPAPSGVSPRPLWLLPDPQALATNAGTPQWRGALTLHSGPERIESGWWQQDCTRDYFIADANCGPRLWIFRERRSRAWFLHGFFA